MAKTKIAPLIVVILSLALLIPGITRPLMTLQADMNRQALVSEGKKVLNEQKLHPAMASIANQFLDNLRVEGQSQVYDKTRSILGTAEDLWNFGYKLVAILILTFSVVIPGIKSLMLLSACLINDNRKLLEVSAVISKWSMADVFAMGVLIASLAANAASSESAILSFHASLHDGFYWFLAYCLISGAAGQWLAKEL